MLFSKRRLSLPISMECRSMKLNRKKLKWLAVGLLSLTMLWLVCSLAVGILYTHRMQSIFNEPAPQIARGQIEPLRLHTDDGEELGAWFIDAGSEKPVVVVLHGNGGCRTCCLPIGEGLVQEGYSVLLVTMRAHGDSTGSLNDFGYGSRYDVMSAIKWLHSNHPDRRIVVWGQSL